MKKIRFGDLVRHSGRPEIFILWTEPNMNRSFTRAIKENRVLTVILEQGKRDYGTIGFERKPGAVFLLFPRPLPKGRDARVIGINYALVEQPNIEPRPKVVKRKAQTGKKAR